MTTKTNILCSVFAVLALVCFALSPGAQAVSPAPDGGYGFGNTAVGDNALYSLSLSPAAAYNTAIGFLALDGLISGLYNTALGAGTLVLNKADENTATGAGALLNNTLGINNTANGAFALFSNTTGDANTATGRYALGLNTGASGGFNTANGANALVNNTNGAFNTAIGNEAGSAQTTGTNNVYIGSGMVGVAGESNACYIKSIFGQTSANGLPVLINSNNKIGTSTSSKRFKEDIKSMNNASEALFSLKPVTFRYKQDIDPDRRGQFGLVAEDVEKVNRDLVVRDKDGKPYSVRYDAVNAMLLNEFLKEHRKVQEQAATIAQLKQDFQFKLAEQQEQIKVLTSGLEKLTNQLELNKAAPRVVADR